MNRFDALAVGEFVDDAGGAIVGISCLGDMNASGIEGGIDEVEGFSAELWLVIDVVARALNGAEDVLSAGA